MMKIKKENENQTVFVSQSYDPVIQKIKALKARLSQILGPKRPITAYANFTEFFRKSIKKSGRPMPKIGEFSKECAAKWKGMTEDEKRPFIEVAERDRERYNKEVERLSFRPANRPNRPKRPPGTPFALFITDFRKELIGRQPQCGVAELAMLGGKRWRKMTEEEKKRYIERHAEIMEVYEKEMKEYNKRTYGSATIPSNRKESTCKSTCKWLQTRPTIAYTNFREFIRKSIKKSGRPMPKIDEFSKECAAKWNTMSEDEKKPFIKAAERDKERYRKKMNAFRRADSLLPPKRPGTAFVLFMFDFRMELVGENHEYGAADLPKLAGTRWRAMTEEEKKPYIDEQIEHQKAYEKQMEEYNRRIGGSAPTRVKSEESGNRKTH